MKAQLTLAALAVTLLVAGWLAGGAGNVAEAQEQVVTEEWKMFSNNVAGTGGSGGGANEFASGGTGNPVIGTTWLYNTKTGKVYRVWSGCGEGRNGYSGDAGCLFAVQVYSGDRLGLYQPNPLTDDPPGFER